MQSPGCILIVNWRDIRNPEAGGAELHLQEVARRMTSMGTRCVLYAHRFKGAPEYEVIDGVEVYRKGNRWLFNFTVYFGVRRWVAKHRPDAVIDDSNKLPFFLPWLLKTPVLVRIHHLFGGVIFREASFLPALYVFIMEKMGALAWRSQTVVTVSESTRQELIKLRVRDVHIAPNGVDFKAYAAKDQVAKRPLSLVYVGRIKHYKRLDFLLSVLEKLRQQFPSLSLTVAGGGDDLPRLRHVAERMGLSGSVRLPGYISEEDKIKLFQEASVVVNPSLKEGWGLTVIEANACGTPVVAADVPGLRDSVRHGQTGFLVPPDDPAAFAEKVAQLLRDPVLLEKMQVAAVKWAQEHTWERTCDLTLQILSRILEK